MKKLVLPLVAIVFFGFQSVAQNVGFGTNDPKSKLDINGGLSLREGPVITLANGGAQGGANDNIALPDITTGVKASFYRIAGPTAAFSLYGIIPTAGADGQVITLVNTTANVMTIKNNGSSITANNIKTLTGSDMVSVAGNSSVTMHYNKTEGLWYVTASQNYVVTTGSVATGDLTTGNSAITLTNNTGRLVGTSAMTVDVKTNALNQAGLVNGPTGGNGSQVWGTDATGHPAWVKADNTMLTNNSITINAGTGLSGGGTVALGGTVTLNNAGGTVTGVTGTSPISVTGTTAPVVAIGNAASDGSTKGAATFNANDFNDNGSGLVAIDYTNGQKATTSTPGFLTSADWNTFNNKPGGAGTTNTLPKWTAASTLGNSQVTDNGTAVGIGSTNTNNKLQVGGSVGVYDDAQSTDSRYMGGTIEKGWTVSGGAVSYVSVTDAPMGNIVAQATSYTWVYGPRITVDITKDYLVEGWVRATGGSPAAWYFNVQNYDNTGANISGDGTDWNYPVSGQTPPSTWTKYSFIVGPDGVKNHSPSAKYISVGWIANYQSGSATYQFCGWRIKPYDKPTTSSGTTFTAGSVIFAGTSGQLAQNNTNLYWDDVHTRLGIGTTTPADKLQVNGGGLLLSYTAGETPFTIQGYNNGSSLWLISGNTTASRAVIGTAFSWDDQVSINYIPGAVGAAAGMLQIGQLDKSSGAFTHGITALFTNGLERMRINSAGAVGIGTSSPAGMFDVSATTSDAMYLRSSSGETDIDYESPTGGWQAGTNASGNGTSGNQFYVYGNGTGYVATFQKGTGNVGIGTASPTAKLQVTGGSQTVSSIVTDGYTQDVGGLVGSNYIPSHSWTPGSGSLGIFNENGSGFSTREWGDGPFGNRCLLWKCFGSDGAADGGWNTNTFNIDNTKTYRVSVWVKRTSMASGTTYFGCQGSGITYLDGTPETNPYFFCTGSLPNINQWYLIVGYIHASGDASTTSSGGVYDGITGSKVVSLNGNTQCSTDFKFSTSATTQQQRAYLYYNGSSAVQQWFWDPRFEEVNGKETPLTGLLSQQPASIDGQAFAGDKSIGSETSVGSLNTATWTQVRSITITKERSDTPIMLTASFMGVTQNSFIVAVARIRRSGATVGWNMGGTSCNGCAAGTSVTAYETGLAAGSYTYTLEYCSTCSTSIGSTLTAIEFKP